MLRLLIHHQGAVARLAVDLGEDALGPVAGELSLNAAGLVLQGSSRARCRCLASGIHETHQGIASHEREARGVEGPGGL